MGRTAFVLLGFLVTVALVGVAMFWAEIMETSCGVLAERGGVNNVTLATAASVPMTTTNTNSVVTGKPCGLSYGELLCSLKSHDAFLPLFNSNAESLSPAQTQAMIPPLARLMETPRAAFSKDVSPPALLEPNCRKRSNKIIDVMYVGFEMDLVELRFLELYDVVDYFVVTESRYTHSGLAKPLLFARNMHERFARFLPKIYYVPETDVEEAPLLVKQDVGWDLEKHGREWLFRQVVLLFPSWNGDTTFVISGDLDEQPSRQSIYQARSCALPQSIYMLGSAFFQYHVGYVFHSDWPAPGLPYSLKFPVLLTLSALRRKIDMSMIRPYHGQPPLLNASLLGAHMTYFSGLPGSLLKSVSIAEGSKSARRHLFQAVQDPDKFHESLAHRKGDVYNRGWVGRIRSTKEVYPNYRLPWALEAYPERFANILGNFHRCNQ